MYLEPSTSLVKDAHALGLEVYASGFANDDPCMSYNYSYDPSAEILQYIDNSDFSVDGVLTDNPPTASGAIGKNEETCVQSLCAMPRVNGMMIENNQHQNKSSDHHNHLLNGIDPSHVNIAI